MDAFERLKRARARRKLALRLKNKGFSLTDIAKQIGVSKQLAHYYLKDNLKDSQAA